MVQATGDSWTARRPTVRPSPPLHPSACLLPSGPWAGLPGSIRILRRSITYCSAFLIITETGHGGSGDGLSLSVLENNKGSYSVVNMQPKMHCMLLLMLRSLSLCVIYVSCYVIYMLCTPNFVVTSTLITWRYCERTADCNKTFNPVKGKVIFQGKYPCSHLQERSWGVVGLLILIASLTVLCYFQSSLSSIIYFLNHPFRRE